MDTKQIKIESFLRGRRAGMYLAHRLIFPIPINLLNKDSSGWVGRLAGIPNYRNKSLETVKNELRGLNGGNNTLFLLKPNRQRTQVEVTVF